MPSVLAIVDFEGVSPVELLARLTPRSIWSVRAVRSGMLRWACCSATEKGIEVCTPVQDALLVGGAMKEIEDVVAATKDAMAKASELVLDGCIPRTDTTSVKSPDRYSDKRGAAMCGRVMRLLKEVEA